MMWCLLHLLALFVFWPFVFVTVPMHIISEVNKNLDKHNREVQRQLGLEKNKHR
jgi:hypothetical protein